MDIAAMSMSLSSAKIQQSAGISVAKKAMNVQETEAAGLMEMVETAGPTSQSQNGIGQNVDVLA